MILFNKNVQRETPLNLQTEMLSIS